MNEQFAFGVQMLAWECEFIIFDMMDLISALHANKSLAIKISTIEISTVITVKVIIK